MMRIDSKRLLTIGAFALVSCSAIAGTLSGRVVAISNGDAITVLDARKKEHKVRIAGINAPQKAQPYGDRSRKHLSELVYDKAVDVEWRKYDRYGRIVGKIMMAAPNSCPASRRDCPRTLDVGLAQIGAGLAWHFAPNGEEQTPQARAVYSFSEQVARGKRVGLWADTAPIPPWQWRSDHKQAR